MIPLFFPSQTNQEAFAYENLVRAVCVVVESNLYAIGKNGPRKTVGRCGNTFNPTVIQAASIQFVLVRSDLKHNQL